jgi:predicted nucleic acid-binding protein
MAYNKLFIDSDILLDLLLERRPFDKFTELLLEESRKNRLDTYTSALILANIHYIISKRFDKNIAKKQLRLLVGMIKTLPLEPDDIANALNSEHSDFEDTVQFYIAQKNNCDLIISRNIKHYKKFDIPVLTAADFLNTL